MSFTALAMFTTVTPPEDALSLGYRCNIEKDPANDTFTIRVFNLRGDQEEVSSATLTCPPSVLTEAARSHVQERHPDRGFTLTPFEPFDEWRKMVTRETGRR